MINDNLEYSNLNLFSFVQADNLEDCANKCEDTSSCLSFNYDRFKKSCEMYNQNGTVTQPNVSKMSGFKIKRKLSTTLLENNFSKMFHLTQKADTNIIARLANGKKN